MRQRFCQSQRSTLIIPLHSGLKILMRSRSSLSWKARTEGVASNTTPEELLAASHASCFSMALSHALAQGGHAPRRLETACTVEFGPKAGGGFEVKGQVPGIDQAAFQKAAEDAKSGCPISAALKIPMKVKATLQG